MPSAAELEARRLANEQARMFKDNKSAYQRARALAIHASDPELSACAIADRLGLSKGTVMKWIRDLRETETVQ